MFTIQNNRFHNSHAAICIYNDDNSLYCNKQIKFAIQLNN